ncbi:hypothetical protein AGABI2DRAFT_120034 [Agaricus bisporus var. bisporus H97]|uniref:hypothetical protein n=1 Tax=Agaricus bisporus var. bisporus (strain H97 / ATCC MYA-4626 / FGSC 10389) TaxID=936046 RepID=UPI00029F640E|nr:hypothetical protein AGABI2DRAFT_120034 [Agaricus bisporus var. bisporus H97]EKV45066.1 hypothetical protein AGABI2DRAFT_120034 [Agaricus bisporus var. bisporus H97]
MPDFSFRRPQFLRFRRSRSTADARGDAGVSSAGLDLSHALDPSEQDVELDATPCVTRRSVSGGLLGSRESLNRAPVDFAGQPLSASRPVTPTVPILSSRDSVTIQLTPPSDNTNSVHAQQYLALPPSRRSFHAETINPPAGRDPPQLQQQNGMFSNPHNFSIKGSTFVDVNVTNNNNTIASQFMKDLLEKTIPGAASNSSARFPPPQCHPGTRLKILERCLQFIANCDGKRKIRWVVGSAGVGKSAIMQSVADSPSLPVTCYLSVFFSINGRDDGTKAIITLCYQLAAKSELYRQLIEHEVARDPSLLQSSMPVQFKKFIIEPFIHQPKLLNSTERILVIIDGLDECKKPDIQLELLRLISDFCITYPSSPFVWLIASRPEHHIASFFSRANVIPAYEKEEIQVDSDDGRADVERFLRERLEEIKGGSDSFDPHSKWPEEKDFWKLAEAAGGLFAYADTVIKYIGDLNVGSPASQFSDVLKVIDNVPMTGIPREEHPMALLDALYARILSNVPDKVIKHTRKLVLALAMRWDHALSGLNIGTFVTLCNWLAMTPDEAYAAVNQLQSLLHTPKRDQAHLEMLEPFHKSFIDYVSDSSRTDFFSDMRNEAQELKTECTFRVLNEAPDGIDFGNLIYKSYYGTLRRGPGTGDKISLTWPVNGCDEDTRLNLYKQAIGEVAGGMRKGDPTFTSEFCVRLLITQFRDYSVSNYDVLRDLVFVSPPSSTSSIFMRLNQITLKAFPGFSLILTCVTLFRRPTRTVAPNVSTVLNAVELPSHHSARAVTNLSDPWNSSCKHEREGEWEEGKDQDWKTTFDIRDCNFCCQRIKRQWISLKTLSPGHIVPVLFTSTGLCCVELRFVDPDDGISEWTYWFWIVLTLSEERKKYGSIV